MRGRNVHYQLEVDFLTAAHGGQQRITLPDGKQLGVTIPEGVADGQTMRLKGLGHPGRGDGPAGDALIEIHVRPHPSFERKGDDVVERASDRDRRGGAGREGRGADDLGPRRW